MTADVVQQAAEIIFDGHHGYMGEDWDAECIAQALHDAGLLGQSSYYLTPGDTIEGDEPKPTEDYLTLMQDIGKLDRLRGEFTDALARDMADRPGGQGFSTTSMQHAARALVAHLDAEREL